LGIAYPGWNIGSLRMLLKAGQGLWRGLTFRSLDSQQRLALQFGMGLLTSQGLEGAILTRLLTGAGPRSIQDLFQPPDGTKDAYGNPNRISTPSYMRTYASLGKGIGPARYEPGFFGKLEAVGGGALNWAQNVSSPIWGTLLEVAQNRDRFTGEQIWDRDAPLSEMAKQTGEYFFTRGLPFGPENVLRMRQQGTSWSRNVAALLGASPVAAQYTRQPMENFVQNWESQRAERGGLTQEQYAVRQAQNMLENALRTRTPLQQNQVAAINKIPPELRSRMITDATKAAELPKIVNQMRKMELHDVLGAWDIAKRSGDAKNEAYSRAVILDKWDNMKDDPERWARELEKTGAGAAKYQRWLGEIIGPVPEPAAEEPAA
jgi:hypothetical protein